MFSFLNLAATHRPRFLLGRFKTLGYMYAELVCRPLEGIRSTPYSHACLSVGSTQGIRYQLSIASPRPNPGIMPLPGVEL